MTTIVESVESVEISRTPAEVFAYVTDPSPLPEWQASVVDVKQDDPLVVNRQAKREMPENMQRLKERLESQ